MPVLDGSLGTAGLPETPPDFCSLACSLDTAWRPLTWNKKSLFCLDTSCALPELFFGWAPVRTVISIVGFSLRIMLPDFSCWTWTALLLKLHYKHHTFGYFISATLRSHTNPVSPPSRSHYLCSSLILNSLFWVTLFIKEASFSFTLSINHPGGPLRLASLPSPAIFLLLPDCCSGSHTLHVNGEDTFSNESLGIKKNLQH